MTKLFGSSLASPGAGLIWTVKFSPLGLTDPDSKGVSGTHMLVMALRGDAGTQGDKGGAPQRPCTGPRGGAYTALFP